MRPTRRSSLALAALLLGLGSIAEPAWATDGVIEINHTKALTGGVVPNDAPGYPISIDVSGSYRLTSDLTVPANARGIIIQANRVAIDLNGFEIAGPFVCNPGACSYGNGDGIIRTSGLGRASVRNGAISGFAGNGILLGELSIVENVALSNLGGGGIYLGEGSVALANRVAYVGRTGLSFTGLGGTFRDNTFYETGRGGVYTEAVAGYAGKAAGPNWCSDGSCSRRGARRYYLTKGTFNGANTLNACEVGFHFASLYEIWAFGTLEYDVRRGQLGADSGSGPASHNLSPGWVRTGYGLVFGAAAQAGEASCLLWTNSTGTESGSVVRPNPAWNAPVSDPLSPWLAYSHPCNSPRPVWCVED